MKERKMILSTIVSTLVIIGLFVFCYVWYIRPMYLDNLDQEKTVQVKKDQTLRFGKYPDQQKIFGIELEITGSAGSNLDVSIGDSSRTIHQAAVKGKKVDFVYKSEWHSDSCFIRIEPRGKVSGKLEVHCRFLAVD